jgi:hypothetical protein
MRLEHMCRGHRWLASQPEATVSGRYFERPLEAGKFVQRSLESGLIFVDATGGWQICAEATQKAGRYFYEQYPFWFRGHRNLDVE